MKVSFDDIRNKEKGKTAIVCGLGGSLKEYVKQFEKLSKTEKDKYCFISCNNWPKKTHIDVDYWTIANSVFTVKENYEYFNNHKATLVYSDSVDLTDRKFVDNVIKNDYLSYDQRHFNSSPCKKRLECCKYIEPDRKTIQEYLQEITGHSEHYTDAGTVGVHMLALAVILGCNPIYVSGIDMNYETGYVDNSVGVQHDNIGKYVGAFGKQSKIISDSAELIGIEIINLNNNAPYGGIKKGEFIEK